MIRIVDRPTFLAMPAGTVYSKFQPNCFDPVEIKGDTSPGGIDFLSQQISGAIEWGGPTSLDMEDRCDDMRLRGASVPMDFDAECRDGCFDADQLFAVWETDDVGALLLRLIKALGDGYRTQQKARR